MNVRWVFCRGAYEVTTIDIVRNGPIWTVSATQASGSVIHERLPTVIEAILRHADYERQLVGSGWHLAGFEPVDPMSAVRGASRPGRGLRLPTLRRAASESRRARLTDAVTEFAGR